MNLHLKAVAQNEQRKAEQIKQKMATQEQEKRKESEEFQNIILELQEKVTSLESEAQILRHQVKEQSKQLLSTVALKSDLESQVSELEALVVELQQNPPKTMREKSSFSSVQFSWNPGDADQDIKNEEESQKEEEQPSKEEVKISEQTLQPSPPEKYEDNPEQISSKEEEKSEEHLEQKQEKESQKQEAGFLNETPSLEEEKLDGENDEPTPLEPKGH